MAMPRRPSVISPRPMDAASKSPGCALEHGGYPDMPFNQQALFPVELTLRTVDGRIQLCREPIREIDRLHGREWQWTQHGIRPGENLLSNVHGELFELRAEIELRDASEISFRVRGATLRYDPTRRTLSCYDKTVPERGKDRLFSCHVHNRCGRGALLTVIEARTQHT